MGAEPPFKAVFFAHGAHDLRELFAVNGRLRADLYVQHAAVCVRLIDFFPAGAAGIFPPLNILKGMDAMGFHKHDQADPVFLRSDRLPAEALVLLDQVAFHLCQAGFAINDHAQVIHAPEISDRELGAQIADADALQMPPNVFPFLFAGVTDDGHFIHDFLKSFQEPFSQHHWV